MKRKSTSLNKHEATPNSFSTSFSVRGGEQSARSSPLRTGVRLLSSTAWLPSSLPSLVCSWSWMYASWSMPGLLWDLRLSRVFPIPLLISEYDSATWLPGLRDISTGPKRHILWIKTPQNIKGVKKCVPSLLKIKFAKVLLYYWRLYIMKIWWYH